MDGITSKCDKFTEIAYDSLLDTGRHVLKSGLREKKSMSVNDIMCGFLQGDSYSPVGFCFSEVPLCKLLQETKDNQKGQPGKR